MAKSSAEMLKSTQPGVLSGHLLNGVRVGHRATQRDWDTLSETRGDVLRIDIPADPQERVAFVRRWMARNQKTLKQGGMAATLVLPLLAQQAFADQMVSVNDLQGVAEVIRQPNGSLTLIMNTGQRIDIAAADVALEGGRVVVDIDSLMQLLGNESGLLVPLSQLPDVQTWELLPDGNVMITRTDGTQMVIERGALVQQGDLFLISPSNALQQGIADGEDFGNLLFVPSAAFTSANASASSFPSTASSSSAPVSSFGDIPPWLYIGGGALAVGAAAAGGGGGGGGSPQPEPPLTISGYVIDGYISGATVTREFDTNSVTTNNNGFFTGLQGSGILTATGGVDISTGLPFTGELRAPEDATVITPLTTLMVQLSQQFGLNDADAQAAIKTSLGLDQRIDLMTTDPLAESSPNLDLLITGVKVASLLAMAATAGVSSADVLSLLGSAFNQASEAGRELTNQEMADALGLPSIAVQVKQALDAIDNASDGLNVNAYRDGNSNPLRDAQRDAQDPDSDLSETIDARADLPFLTLQQAVALVANDELPEQYLIDPDQVFAAGTLGLTDAAEQLALVEAILAGDFDNDTAPIELAGIYNWSIRADAEDILIGDGLENPEITGAERVTLTNETIRPGQYRDLSTLDNFDLADTVVPYTLQQALNTDRMPSNFTLDPETAFQPENISVRQAAEFLDGTRQLLDRAQNGNELERSELLEWSILDDIENVLGTSSERTQIRDAEAISVTQSRITPEEFVELSALPNFLLGETEVDYTLAEALDADPLADNYIIDLDAVLNAGTVTVDEAEAAFTNVSQILEGANNQPPLTLFEWRVSDTAEAVIADLGQEHVTQADQVSASDRVITSDQFNQLSTLDNFELGTTIVRYMLENAVNAEELAANYDIDTTVPFEAGEVSVDEAAETLAAVERILDDALNTQMPSADELFNWTVVDNASAILEAGNVPHLTRADAVIVSSAPLLAEDLSVQDAAELVDNTRALVELLQNANGDSPSLDQLLEWNIVDNFTAVVSTSADRQHMAEANRISVTEAIITPAQFVQLNALPNFVLGETEVDYTLAEALGADPLADNYIIDLDTVLNAGTVTVDEAEAVFTNVSQILEGANNQPPLTLFEWRVSDTAEAVIADLGQEHVTQADQVSTSDRVITSDQFNQLRPLDNFELGTTIVRYTLENAVNAEDLAANYDIDTTVPFEAGEVSVDAASTTLAAVERILDGALNTQTPDADELFNWTVVDSASAILEAGNVPHLVRADAVNVSDDIITIAQFEKLSTADFNYVRLGELVEYTLANAISVIDAGNGPLVADYVIGLGTSFNDVWTVAQGQSYFAIIAGAENRTALLASDAVVWQIEDTVGNLIAGISNVSANDNAFGDDAIINSESVRVLGANINQAQYEELLEVLGNTLRLDASGSANTTTVTYADIAAAVGAEAGGVLAPSEFYSITAITPYTNPNGALSVANALNDIATVEEILEGSTNRDAADFATFYNWSITDSARNILDAITTSVPEVLEGAGSIFAANGGPNGNILAAEYDALVNGLGEGGFNYNEVAYTLAYVFDEENESFAAPGDLADRFFFTEDVFEINDSLGEDNINVALAAEYYSAVQALVDRSGDPLGVEDIYGWSVLDNAANIVSAYTSNSNQHPLYIENATLVKINDTVVITFEQYGILEQIPGFEIQSYTLEEAVELFLEGESELEANYIIDTEAEYRAQNLSVADALTYKEAVDTILGNEDAAARNARINDEALGDLYSWTIRDSAENILDQKSGTEFFTIISEASGITLTDASIVFEDEYLKGLEVLLSPSDLANVRVDFFYNATIDIDFIEREGFENNYGILASSSGPLELEVTSESAQAEYQRVFDVVDGASNATEEDISSLVIWNIDDSVDNIDVNDPWVELAQEIQLTETGLTASQFLKFVTVTDNEVSVLGSLQTDTLTNVSFTPQEAYDNRIAFLDIASSNPGYSLSILSAPVVAFATPFSVADANTLDATLDELISAAGTAPSKLDAYSWRVEDSATNLLDDVSGELIVIDDAGVQNASEVRVTDSEISISQYEALVQLDTFVDAGFIVGYSLEEALDRLPSEFGLAENYTLIDATPFDIGELNAYDAQRIYQLVERLIDGAQNGADVSVDSLMDWVVKDTLAGYEDIGIKTNNDYLREADGVIITGSGVNGEIENGEGQANRQAFSGTDIAYTEEAGFPASPYSLTYTLNGSETLGDPIIDFSTGAGSDQLFIELTAAEITSLRGDGSGFADKTDAEELGANEAFAVFSTEEFVNGGADWLADLGLGTGDVVYLLAGNGDTADISDDAQLFRIENTGTEFDAQTLANFENLDLNNFLDDNWNTNYSIT